MFVVIDTNTIYSILLSRGDRFTVFFLNKLLNKFQFVAPEFLFFEIGRHLDDIVIRSKLSREELSGIFAFLKEQIELVPLKDFNFCALEAEKLAPHEKDVQYFALSLALNKAPIWSNEKAFSTNQKEIKIVNTLDLLKELFSLS